MSIISLTTKAQKPSLPRPEIFSTIPAHVMTAEHIRKAFQIAQLYQELRYGSYLDHDGNLPEEQKGYVLGYKSVMTSRMPWDMKLGHALHLFGHIVQWNDPDADQRYKQFLNYDLSGADENTLRRFEEFELEAASYGMAYLYELMPLLEDAGIPNLGWLPDWYARFSRADIRYITEYFEMGEHQPRQEFALYWMDAQKLPANRAWIQPKPAPSVETKLAHLYNLHQATNVI